MQEELKDRLKFKIYCKSENKTIIFNNPSLLNGKPFEGGLLFKNYDHNIKDIESVDINDLFIRLSTGWKDKHNELAYSGDIVKQNSDVYVIEVSTGGFSCRNIKTKSLYQFFVLSDRHAEIIGNVYENQELLEGIN